MRSAHPTEAEVGALEPRFDSTSTLSLSPLTCSTFPRPTSVKGRVLAALLRGEELTSEACWRRYCSSRLAHHVHKLRQADWPIVAAERSVDTADGRQAVVAFYSLPASAIQAAGDAGAQFVAAVAAAYEVRK